MKEVCMEAQSTTPSYNRIQNFERFSQRSPFLRYPIPLFDGMGLLHFVPIFQLKFEGITIIYRINKIDD